MSGHPTTRARVAGIPFIAALPLLTLLLAPAELSAATINIFGDSTGSLATATEVSSFNAVTNTFTFTLTNTSPFDARITSVGFDVLPGDANGFSGISVGSFTFRDLTSLGNVPQFNSAELDFGWLTGNNNFGGGSPNDGIAPGNSLTFTVFSPLFAGFTDSAIAEDIFVRFQRVGANGEGSDVGVPSGSTPPPPPPPPSPIPEPMSLTLLGSGLLAARAAIGRRRRNDSG